MLINLTATVLLKMIVGKGGGGGSGNQQNRERLHSFAVHRVASDSYIECFLSEKTNKQINTIQRTLKPHVIHVLIAENVERQFYSLSASFKKLRLLITKRSRLDRCQADNPDDTGELLHLTSGPPNIASA